MPRPKKPPTETVRMPIDLVRRITILAAHRGQSVPEYLAEILRPIADRHHAEMLDELCRERGLPLPRATRKRPTP
jgi:predicted DNA-binding protein